MRDGQMPPALQEARDWIADDDIDSAMEVLLPLLSGFAEGGARAWSELRNDVIVQTGRAASLRKQTRRGLMTSDQAGVAEARQTYALLDVIDDIERRLKRGQQPVPPSPAPLVKIDTSVSGNPEKIMGRNSLKSIAWMAQGLAASRSVCRIQTPQWSGTGFHIGGGRIVTNHHVVPDAETAAQTTVEFNFQRDEDGKMEQSTLYHAQAAGYVSAPAPLDCAILQVPEAAEGWGALMLATSTRPEIGAPVSIVQHPLGGEKQIVVTSNEVVGLDGARVVYLTDTLGGSSGAPVFNEAWQVCALHRAGSAAVRGPDGRLRRGNEGILVAALLADGAVGPTLRG